VGFVTTIRYDARLGRRPLRGKVSLGDAIVNNENYGGQGPDMSSAFTFFGRAVVGLVILVLTWFVFDRIHDRNTEILAALIGLQYSFIFLISRRLDYFGLSLFSFFGRTVSYIQKLPYDQVLRDDVGVSARGRHLYLNVLFAALIELLCVFRLFSSLVGYGWQTLSDPLHNLIATAF
jgi:hypothetical protein